MKNLLAAGLGLESSVDKEATEYLAGVFHDSESDLPPAAPVLPLASTPGPSIPASHGYEASILARIFAGEDITAAEIQSMPDKVCAVIATVLCRSKGLEQRKTILQTLLSGAGIDEGSFYAPIFRFDKENLK
jgi:hypothetical protein